MTENIAADELREYASRVSRLTDEKEAISSDLKELMQEIKSKGYSTRVFNAALKKHRMTAEDRSQADLFEQEVEVYLDALDGR